MHLSQLLILTQGLALTHAAIPRAICAADNCARAVSATIKGAAFSATARADCSSFLLATVTSGTTITPTKVPAYASPCSSTARYSSACSCLGVAKSTLTVTPTTTSTSTTSTSTSTSTPTSSAPACPTPEQNILVDPGFNSGTLDAWAPGGGATDPAGSYSFGISTDSQCGSSSAKLSAAGQYSYARIGQRFDQGNTAVTLDSSRNYQITTYAKLVSGDGTNCGMYFQCQDPNGYTYRGYTRLDTELVDLPGVWTKYRLSCPEQRSYLMMSVTVQCNAVGAGPVTVGLDELSMTPLQK